MSFPRNRIERPGLSVTQKLLLASSDDEENFSRDLPGLDDSDSENEDRGFCRNLSNSSDSDSENEDKGFCRNLSNSSDSDSESEEEGLSESIAPDPIKVGGDRLFFGKALGEGAYGLVREAQYAKKQITVAVKILMTEKSYDFAESELKACKAEKNMMQTLTDMNAPNCVRLHDFSFRDPNYYIMMEYMSRGSLNSYITNKEQPPLDMSLRFQTFYSITQAVVFLHSHNIVHRDIKSGNILFDDNWNAKLGDFGNAKVIDKTIDVAGSPGWMAPEVGVKPATTKADIFSLITTLWELMAWKLPFDDVDHPLDIVGIVITGGREIIPETCPESITKLITWGWMQVPAKRPSAEQVLEELDTIKITI